MSRSIAGQNVMVTGGSRGLGRALGEVARHADELADTVAAIRAAGGEAHAVVADVAARDATHAIAGQAAAAVGPIDVLVNNASTLGPVPLRLLLDTDCEDLERALAVNLVGPFRLTKAVAGPMVLRGRGTIINVTSDAATEAYERWGAYGASKAALEQLGRVWAAELAGTGVRVLNVDPGEMDTRMHADAIPDANRAELADPPRVAAEIVALLEADPGPTSGARIAIRTGPTAAAAGSEETAVVT